jgi:hypothetical protein
VSSSKEETRKAALVSQFAIISVARGPRWRSKIRGFCTIVAFRYCCVEIHVPQGLPEIETWERSPRKDHERRKELGSVIIQADDVARLCTDDSRIDVLE